ncbi:MAG TPA: VOC family protein [Candidatus Nitrosotalea sp.]|nr:VOC family protein [Candidatus Nitrosotalea sp.]
MNSIAAATRMGPVHLGVTDATRSLRFYEDVVGLRQLSSVPDQIRHGAGERELVVLEMDASGPVQEGHSGLYHLAIVVPRRRDLAQLVRRLLVRGYPNSPTDHVQTKSDYLWDPDGNGLEIYAESPEDGSFRWDERGGFTAVDSQGRERSGRDPIDLEALLAELGLADALDQPLPPGSRVGHVHLHVSHLQDAVDFYHGLVGFDVMGQSSRARMAFVSAGGYHHHLGLNTWAGEGAPGQPAGAAGLRHFAIDLPTQAALEEVLERLGAAGVVTAPLGSAVEVRDPSGNRARLAVRAP